jgi:uncharacterized membrane protein YfcA
VSLSPELLALLTVLMFAGAVLYTSVGHAGASAYLALMGLFGVAPIVMRPTGLALNVLVSSLTSIRYGRAGLFDWRTLWPFLLGAIPAAFISGSLQIPGNVYRPLVGIVLFAAAARLLWPSTTQLVREVKRPPIIAAVIIGAWIGLLSGLTGTGGGIFLSPVLLFMGWADPRKASGITSVFILGNSLSGLAGNITSIRDLPPELPLFAVAVLAGGTVGTYLGIKRLPTKGIVRALGLVLIVAGFKLLGLY